MCPTVISASTTETTSAFQAEGPPSRQSDLELILIADDHAPSLEFARTVLDDSGYGVCAVSDGLAAVIAAFMLVPDLIILELDLPELDGFGVLRELKNDGRFEGTAFVALTASATREDEERIFPAGFDTSLVKPVSVHTLRSEVALSLRNRRTH